MTPRAFDDASPRFNDRRSSVIHAVHGLSASGQWFLLADLAPGELARLPLEADDGLVILSGRDSATIANVLADSE
jgi:hypothetical protein